MNKSTLIFGRVERASSTPTSWLDFASNPGHDVDT